MTVTSPEEQRRKVKELIGACVKSRFLFPSSFFFFEEDDRETLSLGYQSVLAFLFSMCSNWC